MIKHQTPRSFGFYAVIIASASALGCAGLEDPDRVALAESVPAETLRAGSAADVLDWYDGLDEQARAAVLEVMIAHADTAFGLAGASLAELRANQAELYTALSAVVAPEDLAAFPAPSTLGAPLVATAPRGTAHVIDDDHADDAMTYTIGGTAWSHDALDYCIDNYLGGMNNDKQRNQISKAGEMWAESSPLTFTKVSDCADADIKIKFKDKSHDEDGCGGFSSGSVLAHARYPVSNGSRVYMHVNKKWDWENVGNMSGWDKTWNPDAMDLRTVVAHEMGHNIGIGHSSYGNAVMYPTIANLETKWNLHSDDIAAVQARYGASLADTAYARAAYAQALVGRSVLIMRELASDSPEARDAIEALTDGLVATDAAVRDARRAAIAERDDDAAAAMAHTVEVAGDLERAWQALARFADAEADADLDRILVLTEEAFVTMSAATADLAVR